MTISRYPIRIGRKSAAMLLLWGVTRSRAWVDVGDDWIRGRFGWFHVEVPVDAVTQYRLEGPWRWITAIGVRRSLRGGDISFAGSPRGGVRLDLRAPVKWFGLRVPAFYFGIDDLDGVARHLDALGIAGEDARGDAAR